MTFKTCTACKTEQPIDQFTKRTCSKDGLHYRCKSCNREQCKEWHKNNQARSRQKNAEWRAANKEYVKQKNAEWYQANKERARELDRAWRERNPERAKDLRDARWARWAERNPEARKESRRAQMRRPERRMARQIWGVLRGEKAGRRWSELLGYDETELRAHLERQFTKGMSWDNYGEWHIDHIVALADFEITGPECPELRRAWSLPNLRPLWAKDNLAKNRKRTSLL